MEKILYSNFESVGDILSELKKKLQPKKQSKVLTLFLAWNEIAGQKLAQFSKPVGLSKDKTLIVACKNSMISQELYLQKQRILNSAQFYAESLKLTVKDICFSHKIWGKYNSEEGR
ncbi:DUF721 domain-containing protein [bacterium]|nr:DUF721 domain-containing protein [bacterium]